ncbi:MAG: glucose-6-phosphate isomerase family protein [Candidatus Bathyarchaeia archaeon]
MLNKGFYIAKIVGVDGIYPYKSKVERYLSDMREHFMNRQAVEEILSSGRNPLIYVVYEIAREEQGELNVGCTVIYPGKIGDEYYFTKGHFHKNPLAGEIYIGVSGEGLILMQDKGGAFSVGEIESGTIVYVPPGFAHRTVNTGKTELVFLAIYPSDAGHDYETIMRTGFAKVVVERGGKPTLIDNPNYRRL